MVRAGQERVAFGKPLAEQGVVHSSRIAESRIEIEQARLLPQVACDVIDRAIQVHGAAGISDDTRWPACTAGTAPCGCSTAPTRCTCAPSPAPSSAMSEKPDDEDVAVAAGRFMTEEYLRFPTLGGAQRAVRQVISLLAEGRPVITHCFAGKDRTGFTVATVLGAIGIDRDAILADFLRSNDAVPQLRDRIMESVRDRSETPEVITFAEARLSDEVLGVREDYLDASRRSIEQNYGSLRGYLEAAGVTAEDVTRVRTALLG
jgi:hypothetical protein